MICALLSSLTFTDSPNGVGFTAAETGMPERLIESCPLATPPLPPVINQSPEKIMACKLLKHLMPAIINVLIDSHPFKLCAFQNGVGNNLVIK